MWLFLVVFLLSSYLFARLLPFVALSLIVTFVVLALVSFGGSPTSQANAPPICAALIVGALALDLISMVAGLFSNKRPPCRR